MASILERNKDLKIKKKTREEYAEDALYREVWEEVNNEKTQAFIKKYSRYLIAGALVILIIVTGIQIGVQTYKSNKLATAVNYETAVENMDAKALERLADNSSGATADLALFQSYILEKDTAKLEKLANEGNSKDFRDLAKLHIVNIQGDDMTPQEVEDYLSDLDTKKSPFYYLSRLVVAQKYLSVGDSENANKWLDVILTDKQAPATISASAQLLK